MSCICEARKNSGQKHTTACDEYHKMCIEKEKRVDRKVVIQEPVRITCPGCNRSLESRDDGNIRLHTDAQDAFCSYSGKKAHKEPGIVERGSQIRGPERDRLADAMVVRRITSLIAEKAEEPAAVPSPAAVRLRAVLESAREGNYLSCWPSYASGADVEALLLYVEQRDG